MDGLEGKVAVVTGASRGLGRGIAHELGIAGATVYVTGRTRAGEQSVDGAAGTIDGAADLITEAGGQGIAVAVDHTRDEEVQALADRVRTDHGHLDLLVNNVWGGYEGYEPEVWQQPIWEQPADRWDRMFDPGVRAHFTAARALGPLLVAAKRALVVAITAGDEDAYLGDVSYDVAKHAQQRLAFALAQHLGDHGVASLAIASGFARTERVLDAFGIKEKDWQDVEDLTHTHSPRFVGRCVVALATEPDLTTRNGGTFKAGQLGLDYGFTDVDDRQPEPFELARHG